MRTSCFMLRIGMLILNLILLVQSCIRPRNPLGSDDQIRVIADSTIWRQCAPVLREIFEQVENTPQPEKIFNIIKGDPDNFKRFKNLILISTLNSRDEISQAINSNLTAQARLEVESGHIVFIKKNQWAAHQLVMFLIGKDVPSLLSKINELKTELFFQFDDYWNHFHREMLYRYKEQLDLELHLLTTYGWMIRVPVDYQLKIQSLEDGFVMFHRQYPLRWLAIYWMNAKSDHVMTKEWCIAKRNEIGRRFYENEVIEEQYAPVVAEEVSFLNRRAYRLRGLWKNEEKVAGGPFRMYCFYDAATERIYFIDMHLFSPDLKKSKLHYLRQMEIIAATFKTKIEIKPEKLTGHQ